MDEFNPNNYQAYFNNIQVVGNIDFEKEHQHLYNTNDRFFFGSLNSNLELFLGKSAGQRSTQNLSGLNEKGISPVIAKQIIKGEDASAINYKNNNLDSKKEEKIKIKKKNDNKCKCTIF